MARRRPPNTHGLAVVDKPAGFTSHDVVGMLRRRFGERQVGHAGTLDPDATGVLLVHGSGFGMPAGDGYMRIVFLAAPDELREVYKDFHPDVRALLAACDSVTKSALYVREPMERWSEGHVTILGDAAHPMLPTGSQAGSQAVVDARVLAQALLTETSVEAALRSYETQRLRPMADSEKSMKNLPAPECSRKAP